MSDIITTMAIGEEENYSVAAPVDPAYDNANCNAEFQNCATTLAIGEESNPPLEPPIVIIE